MILPKDRIKDLATFSCELGIKFSKESEGVYLARAVSSVLASERPRLEVIFGEIIDVVREARMEPLLPVELDEDIDPNSINPNNHHQLIRSKMVMPLTYATSDGRGWEMGFSYGRKLLVPIVMPDQKINTPTLRLPFQIPVIYSGPAGLTNLIGELKKYEIGFGNVMGRPTVLGFQRGSFVDIRALAKDYVEVLPTTF